jgi:hypothetical protein
MKMSSCYPSKYLKAADIPPGRDVPCQIDRVEIESMESDGQDKPVMYFINKLKGLVLNKTNADVIAAALGDEADGWHGATVALFAATTQFGGRPTPCIRLRVTAKPSVNNGQAAVVALPSEPVDLPF